MLLKITHQTDLAYSDLISEAIMELRMAPRQEQDQHRLSFSLSIGPPTSVTTYFDWLGNTVHVFSIGPFHSQIRIAATSVVETIRPIEDLSKLPDIWPPQGEPNYANYDYLQFGGAVMDHPSLRQLAQSLSPEPGMNLGDLMKRMLQLITTQFTYEKGVTTAASPITEILEHRHGVCQDFTHLMAGLCRVLGIPTRYVSGFVHPDQPGLRGYSQSHAWCEVLFPSVGWRGLDPTNNCPVGANYVRVAVGRDYRDVPPNKGLFKGKAVESMVVAVQSEVMAAIPLGLPAERIASTNVPTYNSSKEYLRDLANQRQAPQQQKHLEYQQQQ